MTYIKKNWQWAAAAAIAIVFIIFPSLTFPTISFVAIYVFSDVYIFVDCRKLFAGFKKHKRIYFFFLVSLCLTFFLPALAYNPMTAPLNYRRLFLVALLIYSIAAWIMRKAVEGKKTK